MNSFQVVFLCFDQPVKILILSSIYAWLGHRDSSWLYNRQKASLTTHVTHVLRTDELSKTFPNNKRQRSETRVPVLRAALLGWPALGSGSLRRWQKPRVAFRRRPPWWSAVCSPARRSLRSWGDTRWRSSGTSAGTGRRGNLEAKAGPRTWANTGTPVCAHPWDPCQYPCCRPASRGFCCLFVWVPLQKRSLDPGTKLTTPLCQRSLRSVLEQEEAAVRTGADDSAQVAAGEQAFADSSPRFLVDRNRGDWRGCWISTTSGYNCAPPWKLQVKLFKMRPPCCPWAGAAPQLRQRFLTFLPEAPRLWL